MRGFVFTRAEHAAQPSGHVGDACTAGGLAQMEAVTKNKKKHHVWCEYMT